MSFDQLMQHAHDIVEKAAEVARREKTAPTTGRGGGGGGPSLDEMRQKFAYVVPAFEPFTQMPDPVKYDLYIDEVKAAMTLLNTGTAHPSQLTDDVMLGNIDTTRLTYDSGKLMAWKGQAADNFNEYFLTPFPTYSGNQVTAMSTMRGALEAHKAMWASARTDIDTIAENALNALDNVGNCSPNRMPFVFTVLSAVATIGSGIITVATGGATAPFVPIAVAAAGGNVALGALNAKGSGQSSSGQSAEAVISVMIQAIETLRQHIQYVEQNQIANAIQKLMGAFDANRKDLVAARPALADMSNSDFRDGMGPPPGLIDLSQL